MFRIVNMGRIREANLLSTTKLRPATIGKKNSPIFLHRSICLKQYKFDLSQSIQVKWHHRYIRANVGYKNDEVSISEVTDKNKIAIYKENSEKLIPQVITDIWKCASVKFGNLIALEDPHSKPPVKVTYRELEENIKNFASGLQALGLREKEIVCLFSDNSLRWIMADQGVMMNRAIDAVRGSQSSLEELEYIISQTKCSGLILQDSDLLMSSINISKNVLNTKIMNFEDLVKLGIYNDFVKKDIYPSDTATLVYTSGTSGNPKGVILTHSNIVYQILCFQDILKVDPGDTMLSLLPPWHIYERTVDYFTFYKGIHMMYSSVKTFKTDLKKYPPDIFVCVPLVLETLYNKVLMQLRKASFVQKTLAMFLLRISLSYTLKQRAIHGKDINYAFTSIPPLTFLWMSLTCALLYPLYFLAQRLVLSKIKSKLGIKKVVVSGGGSLGIHLDDFFEIIGLEILNGWGLTETSPVLACRISGADKNIRGTIGLPLSGTSIKIVDPETYNELEDGMTGLIMAKGPGVMSRYHENHKETEKAFTMGNGWFNTGDCGWRCPENVPGSKMAGHIVLTGRIKDTIILSSGENIEPQPIEDFLCTSPLLRYVMLVGQDRRQIGAFIVPDQDRLEAIESERKGEKISDAELHLMVSEEVARLQKSNKKLKPYEHIAAICILKDGFSVDNEMLTRTMKLRREFIIKVHEKEYKELLGKLR